MGSLIAVSILLAGALPVAVWQTLRVSRSTRARVEQLRAPLACEPEQQPGRRRTNQLGAAYARPTSYFG